MLGIHVVITNYFTQGILTIYCDYCECWMNFAIMAEIKHFILCTCICVMYKYKMHLFSLQCHGIVMDEQTLLRSLTEEVSDHCRHIFFINLVLCVWINKFIKLVSHVNLEMCG